MTNLLNKIRVSAARLDFILPFVISLLTCIPFFIDWDYGYYLDWTNHLWYLTYFSEYFKTHLSFPNFIHSNGIIGFALPIFYGHLFYPLFSIPTILIGAKATIVLLTFLTVFLLGRSILTLMKRLEIPSTASYTIVILFSLSIYQLTNLYNRNALTEYFAYFWLVTGICYFLDFLLDARLEKKNLYADPRCVFSFFLFTLIVGTHPITALFGPIFGVLVILPWIKQVQNIKRKILPILMFSSLSIVCNLHWLYAYIQLGPDLQMQHYFQNPFFYPDRIDTWAVRLVPFPYDPFFTKAISEVSTPFLEAPILTLLVFYAIPFLFFLGRNKSRSALAKALYLLASATGATLLSLYPEVWKFFPNFIYKMQITYRFVNYANLAILFSALVAIQKSEILKTPSLEKNLNLFSAFLVGFTLCGVFVKFVHTKGAISGLDPFAYSQSPENILETPRTLYSYHTYTTLKGYSSDSYEHIATKQQAALQVSSMPFGKTKSLEINSQAQTLWQTNILPFKWLKIYLNSTAVPEKVIQISPRSYTVAFPSPPGKYSLRISEELDPFFISAKIAALWIFFIWFFSAHITFFRNLIRHEQ